MNANNSINLFSRRRFGALLLVAGLGLAACGSDDGIVTNSTDEDITAIAASASVTDTVELHQVIMNDEGQMSMSEKEGGYVIEAGASFTFEPGGSHIMMLGIDPATYPEMVDVTLTFDNGSMLDFTAEVRAIDDEMAEMEDDG
jgi:copper(I)-binding protein